jgi:hypothetical protein
MKILLTDSFLKSIKRMNHPWKIRFFYYDFIYGMKSLMFWFSTIWKNRGWDFTYTLIILKKQLEMQQLSLENAEKLGWSSIDNNKYIMDIKECQEILGRLIEDEYILPEYRAIYKSCIYSNLTEEENMIIRKNLEYETFMRNRDKGRLFQILHTQGDYWWD